MIKEIKNKEARCIRCGSILHRTKTFYGDAPEPDIEQWRKQPELCSKCKSR